MHLDLDLQNLHVLELLGDTNVPAQDRADALIYHVVEHGLDVRQAVRRFMEQADLAEKLKDKLAAMDGHALVMERYVGQVDSPRLYAQVTRGPGLVLLPATAEELDGLKAGDPILVDTHTERIVGRDGQLDVTGDVVQVESRPASRPGQVIVRHHEQSQLARLHHSLVGDQEACPPGSRVIYDSPRNFVLGLADTKSDGAELLVPLDRLPVVRRSAVGGVKPVADEIGERLKGAVEHPDWAQQMRQKPNTSYCFQGPTGGGKSYHAELIVTEFHDYLENLLGRRVSRVVQCDAAQFWTSLFGGTEERISLWAEKLRLLGLRKVHDRQGRELSLPLMVILEEADALLRVRSEGDNSSHLFDRPLAVFLQKIESLGHELGVPVVWLALTNRVDLLDPSAARRVGMRPVFFGTLSAEEAAGVLAVKIPAEMPIRGSQERDDGARDALIGRVLSYVYGPQPSQPLVEVHFVGGERRQLHRHQLLTPALIGEAVSAASDACLMRSRRAGRLLGLDGDDVIQFLHRHFYHLAHTLRPHNVAAHCPEWFAEQSLQVVNVVPLAQRLRRPPALLPN